MNKETIIRPCVDAVVGAAITFAGLQVVACAVELGFECATQSPEAMDTLARTAESGAVTLGMAAGYLVLREIITERLAGRLNRPDGSHDDV